MQCIKWTRPRSLGVVVLLGLVLLYGWAQGADEEAQSEVSSSVATLFFAAMGGYEGLSAEQAIEILDRHWDPAFLPFFIEVYRFSEGGVARGNIRRLLEKHTDKRVARNLDTLNQYVWSQPIANSRQYAYFKQVFYAGIDPVFERYFEEDRRYDIRLDEIAWGGVVQDGIPPLRDPIMISAAEARYLRDSHVVFGIEIDGEARAYPKRILAWHEMFVDRIAGVDLAGVYCTLCGTVIIYETEHAGVIHELGTSGFLYRSNKLMYDRATQSLWSTMEGVPVVGPLAGQGIELRTRSVVTTTWGEWRRRHPDTQVLSLETGHQRDYGEGVATRIIFRRIG